MSFINNRYIHSVIGPFSSKLCIKGLFGTENGSNGIDTTPVLMGKYFIFIPEFHGEGMDLKKHESA